MRLTRAEWLLMNALWQEHPATAREIGQRLPSEIKWAYTTIRTMLTRLVEKGAISEHKRGNLSFYEPVLTRRKARMAALHSLVEQAFDGTFAPLMHFLIQEEALSPAERRKLKEMLEGKSKKGSKK